MKAITIRQPWASLIAEGVKTIETRGREHPWRSAIGETIAIHAAMRSVREKMVFGPPGPSWEAWPADDPKRPHPNHPNGRPPRLYNPKFAASWTPLPLGAVVATCRLVDVVPMVAPANAMPRLEQCMTVGATLMLWPKGGTTADGCEVVDQRPFGDFAPGRWALLLDQVQKCATPYPCRGFQGLWNLPAVGVSEVSPNTETKP